MQFFFFLKLNYGSPHDSDQAEGYIAQAQGGIMPAHWKQNAIIAEGLRKDYASTQQDLRLSRPTSARSSDPLPCFPTFIPNPKSITTIIKVYNFRNNIINKNIRYHSIIMAQVIKTNISETMCRCTKIENQWKKKLVIMINTYHNIYLDAVLIPKSNISYHCWKESYIKYS